MLHFPTSTVASYRVRRPSLLCAALVLMAVSVAGCKGRGGSDGTGDGTTPEEEEVLTSMEDRVRCESQAPVTHGIDVNNDGRADIQHHTAGGRMVCIEIDMNFDGRVDITRFFEADGTPVRLTRQRPEARRRTSKCVLPLQIAAQHLHLPAH